MNYSHLWLDNSDHSTFTCLYATKKRQYIFIIAQVFTFMRICVIFLYLFRVIVSIILLIMQLNVRSCNFYIIWWRFSWKISLSAGVYKERYILRGSVLALNFGVSWRMLHWWMALPSSQAHSIIWSFCLELSCLIGLIKVAHSWNGMRRHCLFYNRIMWWVMCEIVSSPRNNSLFAFINSARQVACILQGGLQLVLKVAHCMEVLYLHHQAHVKINCEAGLRLSMNLWRSLRPLRIMLTDEKWMSELMNEWMNGWMDEWMNGRMDEWTNEWMS